MKRFLEKDRTWKEDWLILLFVKEERLGGVFKKERREEMLREMLTPPPLCQNWRQGWRGRRLKVNKKDVLFLEKDKTC